MKQFVIVYPVIIVTIYFHYLMTFLFLTCNVYTRYIHEYMVSICTNYVYTNKCILEATLFRQSSSFD